jgi:hypothetical protein
VLPALLQPSPASAQIARDCGNRTATFELSETVDSSKYPSLSSLQMSAFSQRLCNEVTKLENFFLAPASPSNAPGNPWWQKLAGLPSRFLGLPDPYQALRGTFDAPYPDLKVLVSDNYSVSEALVPGALGHRGQMQFPAREAVLDEAAVDHELTHVFFPNGNRLLAEGLAVYVQTLIPGANPAFPNYGVPLDKVVATVACVLGLKTPSGPGLITDLDAVGTPSALVFRVGAKYVDGALYTYPVAGSFIKFVIEKYGWDLFHSLYVLTPLVPFERDEGAATRWQQIYNRDLQQLAQDWVAQFAGVICPGS